MTAHLRADRVGPAGLSVTVTPDGAALAALAERLRIPAVVAMDCCFHLTPSDAGAITADGVLTATVVRECVVTLEEFEQPVHERFRVRFVPEERVADDIDVEADEELPFDGQTIDLEDAAAQQLALALDPYPRRPGAQAELPDDADDTHPFAALARRQGV